MLDLPDAKPGAPERRVGILRYPTYMQVQVLYLGMLRDIAGREREVAELPDGANLRALIAQLQEKLPKLGDFRSAIAVAINCEYANGEAELHDGDEVALLPPVSGGKVDGEPAEAETAETLISEHAKIVRDQIDTAAILSGLKNPEDGALAAFDGIVRNNSRGRRTLYLEYTAYERMALNQMEELARRALAEFAIRDVRLVHRLGRLQIGESSVYIAVASAHRAAAFDACRWLIDTLKKTVPIWKKEFFADGAVWADGEAFPPEIPRAAERASK